MKTCEYTNNLKTKLPVLFVYFIENNLNPSNNTGDTKCKGKDDGNYALPDVFHYLQCKKGKSTIVQCKSGKIYSPTVKKCAVISSTTIESFCKDRDDGDWQNPWNCYGYLLCRNGYTLQRPCLINGLVFDPNNDVCRNDYPCHTVSSGGEPQQLQYHPETVDPGYQLPQIKDICTFLKDGNYSTRDVFQILQCKNRTSKMIPCPKDTIYTGGATCTNSSKVNEGLCFILSVFLFFLFHQGID